MALTPEQIDGLRARMEDIAQPIIDWLLADLAQRVAEAGKMTSTAAYEAYRAKALGASQRELKKFLKKQLSLSNREVRRLLRAAARFSSEDDFDRVGVWATEAQRESLEQMTQAAIQLATKDFTNLTQTLGMVDCITGRPLPLQDAYRQAMDFAFEQIFTGAADYETAIRQATRKLADRGVVAIDYASGVSTELGAAVRRNMMGGMGLLVEQITQENHDALGCDGWEISAHAASAPDHEPYQGRQYSDAEYTRLNESLKRRIGTLNCGHVASPIILGVNSPQYTEAELEEFRRANAQGITYEGRHYTAYEATQRRNRFESAIRRQKRRVLVSEKNGDADQLPADRIKLTRLNQEYGKFCKAADLKTRPQRLQQDGFGRRQAAQAGAASRPKASVTEKSFSAGVGSPDVDWDYINSDAYKAKFKAISDNPELNQAIYKYCKAMLTHQSGDYYEDLTILRLDGSLVGQTSGRVRHETRYSKKLKETVQAASPYSLVSIHNHGTNIPPTGSDFVSAGSKKYAFGIVACHDGKMYFYSAAHAQPFLPAVIDGLVDKYIKAPYNLDELRACKQALDEVAASYGIEWRELL